MEVGSAKPATVVRQVGPGNVAAASWVGGQVRLNLAARGVGSGWPRDIVSLPRRAATTFVFFSCGSRLRLLRWLRRAYAVVASSVCLFCAVSECVNFAQ